MVKNLPANAGDLKDSGFDPWVRKIPWRRKWKPTPVLLPGESHGQRSLAGYSPWGCKVSETTEATQHVIIEEAQFGSVLPHDPTAQIQSKSRSILSHIKQGKPFLS